MDQQLGPGGKTQYFGRPPEFRIFICRRCKVECIICRTCDRNNVYCKICSVIAKRERALKANHKYRKTFKGRRKHARNEAARRHRVAVKKIVGDRSSKIAEPLAQASPQQSVDCEKGTSNAHQIRHLVSSLQHGRGVQKKVTCSFCGGKETDRKGQTIHRSQNATRRFSQWPRPP